MNIALFSDSYFPTKSGIVTVVVQLRKILQQMGHHVVVVTIKGKDYEQEEGDETDVFRVPSIWVKKLGQGGGFPNNRKICKFLKKHDIQLIHSHTEFAMGLAALKAAKTLDLPCILSTHTMWEDYYKYYLKISGKLLSPSTVRWALKKITCDYYAYINVSEKARLYYKEPDVNPQVPSAIIPNAIDADKFASKRLSAEEAVEFRKSLGLKKEDKVILYVGRIVQEKRIYELLDVMKRIVSSRDDVKMLFVGSGKPLDDMKLNVEKSGLSDKIIFTGFVDWRKLYQYYGCGDVFVTTSLSEMHSMTILEALSLGVPVVCRRDTSFTDTVFPGLNGYLVDTDEEMDEAIYKVIDDKELHEKMSQNAVKVSENFVLKVHGQRTEAFYKAVLENYPNPISDEKLKAAVDSVEVNKIG